MKWTLMVNRRVLIFREKFDNLLVWNHVMLNCSLFDIFQYVRRCYDCIFFNLISVNIWVVSTEFTPKTCCWLDLLFTFRWSSDDSFILFSDILHVKTLMEISQRNVNKWSFCWVFPLSTTPRDARLSWILSSSQTF